MSTQFDPTSPNMTQGFGVFRPIAQLLFASCSFVKDRPPHYFFALERIFHFTICSPFCQEKKDLFSSRKSPAAAKKLSAHGGRAGIYACGKKLKEKGSSLRRRPGSPTSPVLARRGGGPHVSGTHDFGCPLRQGGMGEALFPCRGGNPCTAEGAPSSLRP